MITNDYTNIYLRVDNAAGTFSSYQQQPLFALRVYSQNFSSAGGPSTSLGASGQPLRRPMSFLVERTSVADDYRSHWDYRDDWGIGQILTGVIEPQWDSASGRLEAVIPISAFTNWGQASFGNSWADVLIVLASYNSTTNMWQENDSMLIHYRLSTPDQNWIYGNIEQ